MYNKDCLTKCTRQFTGQSLSAPCYYVLNESQDIYANICMLVRFQVHVPVINLH